MRRTVTESKVCLSCAAPFSRTRYPSGRLEGITDWTARKFCSHKCYSDWHVGGNHPLFLKEGSVRSDGYVRVACKGKRAYLHRLVAQAKRGLHVHHKDGNPQNNAEDNLIEKTPSDHSKGHAASRERDSKGKFI